MKLSISNIAWNNEYNETVYGFMKENGYSGLEIAPTKIFPEKPYDKLDEAARWSENLKKEYGFEVSSMQSIWFGRQEMLFGTEEERKALLDYTKKAIDFAKATGCGNLVFGCPKNRSMPEGTDVKVAIDFFSELGDYAYSQGTVVGMEANPAIYNTNFVNDTESALDLIEKVNSKGFLLNLDVGTMICNGESVELLKGKVKYINHVHISEPHLKPVEERDIHNELCKLLKEEKYEKYVSIEMGTLEDVSVIKEKMKYIADLFI